MPKRPLCDDKAYQHSDKEEPSLRIIFIAMSVRQNQLKYQNTEVQSPLVRILVL